MKTTLFHKAIRLLIALVGILTLTTSTVLGATPNLAAHSPSEALVRIDLGGAANLERFAASGLEVYAHLYSQEGQEYLLLPATAAQVKMLGDLGFTVNILDDQVGDASYYLLTARNAGALEQAGRTTQVLYRDGMTALAKASAAQAESLSPLGIEIKGLNLHALALPKERRADYPVVIEPDPTIQGMINQVTTDTVYNYDGGLSGEWPVIIGGETYTIMTRNTGQAVPTEKATQFTYEHFQSLGLPASYDYYYHPYYGQRRNVVAEQPGLTQPDRIFLVTAHLDDMPSGSYAPGADDNASGSTGVMIAADILSQYSFDCTLRYVLFTGEEQGLYGSYYYAQDAYNNGDNIEGVLNLDMISYNSDMLPIIDLHTRPGNADDLAIANLFVDVVDAYNIGLTPDILQDGIQYSDHASFWEFGYPAILGIEDDDDFTPYYHTTNDRLNTLNIAYFTNFIKASVGTFAHMGCLLNSGYLAGEVSDSETSSPIAGASVTAQRAAGQPRTTLSGLDGSYQLALPEGTYTVTAQAGGYVPFSVSGIDITMDLTTTLDIPLQPCHILGADFTYSPSDPISGQTVTFTGTVDASSTAPVDYSWDFGDGHSADGQVVQHTYTVSDTYAVNMDAENCAGSSSAAHPVTVTGVPGISVSLQSLDIQAQFSQTVTSTLEIGNSGEQALTWSLAEAPEAPWLDESVQSGELAPQARQEITLTFLAPQAHGLYTTTLQIQSNDPTNPQVDIPVTLEVACSAPQGVDFDFSPLAPRIGQPVTFSGVFTASLPVQFTWDFMDGSDPLTGGNLTTVEHSFPLEASASTYSVTLSIENACSAPVQATEMVQVSPYQAFLPLVPAVLP